MIRGGYQPFAGSTPNQPGLSLAAMLRGRPFFGMNPIQQKRNGQTLAHLLLTGRLPER